MNIIKKISSDLLALYGSIISFIYFVTLLIISHFNIRYVLIGVFIELLTIPFLLLVLFLTFYAIKNIFKGKPSAKYNSCISLLFLITTIILLVKATFYDS